MKLLLTSCGITNKSIEKALLDLCGKPFSELSLAFIPTAANVEEGDKDWFIKDLIILKKLGFREIDIVDISAMPQEMWRPRLEKANVILAEGGNTFHLMHWIEKSGLKDIAKKLLATRVYVGISAGSMVMCPNLDLSTSKKLYYEEASPDYKKDEGLGFVNFLVRPHLNNESFPDVTLENMEKLAKEKTETFYVLDDNSAIKIDGDKIEVISEGVWKKFN